MGLIMYYQLSINWLAKSSIMSAFNVKPLQFLWPITEVVDSLRKQRKVDVKCVIFRPKIGLFLWNCNSTDILLRCFWFSSLQYIQLSLVTVIDNSIHNCIIKRSILSKWTFSLSVLINLDNLDYLIACIIIIIFLITRKEIRSE